MNKTILSVFAGACCAVLFACDAPKDYTPDTKTSVDQVPPGTRNTSNITSVDEHGHGTKEVIMPNHDAGVNEMAPVNEERVEPAMTNDADSVRSHK